MRTGRHRLSILTSWLAQMSVQVDQAGQGDEAIGVNGASGRTSPRRSNLTNAISHDDKIDRLGAQGSHPMKHYITHAAPSMEPPSIRYRTAMRTDTPLDT